MTVLLIGCSLGDDANAVPGAVTFTTDQSDYTLGSTVTVTLSNGSGENVWCNLCFSELEQKQQNGGWKSVNAHEVCQAYAVRVDPGDERRYEVGLVDDLDLPVPSVYRITTDVEIEGEITTLTTDPFEIRSAE